MPDLSTSLAELATTYPAAGRVFHRHRLDFCCRGNRPLAEACVDAGLDPEAVLREILAAVPPADVPALASWPAGRIAEHIVARYHAPLRAELPRLTEMARKVERVHADKAGCPTGLADHLDAWSAEVLDHLDQEERVLFPSLASPDPAVVAALAKEHDDHAAALARTRELAGDLEPPPHACTTWRALYAGLAELERELMQHVHVENHVLFPRATAR